MTLSEYMQAHGITDEMMAVMLKKSRASISRYRRRLEVPSTPVIKQMVLISGGKITANDLLDIKIPAE
jgi:ParB-like chromosome segregation protein Spo0J